MFAHQVGNPRWVDPDNLHRLNDLNTRVCRVAMNAISASGSGAGIAMHQNNVSSRHSTCCQCFEWCARNNVRRRRRPFVSEQWVVCRRLPRQLCFRTRPARTRDARRVLSQGPRGRGEGKLHGLRSQDVRRTCVEHSVPTHGTLASFNWMRCTIRCTQRNVQRIE